MTIATGAAALACEPADFDAATKHTTLAKKDIAAIRKLRKLAYRQADNRKWNYDQCVKACNGMMSCTDQCWKDGFRRQSARRPRIATSARPNGRSEFDRPLRRNEAKGKFHA
ncbi:MAG TPA: hypothetical protein VMD53_08315 [Rhizomicrobium sp.]|nr:hypothetical protein [Rhizomicrobium sp.]